LDELANFSVFVLHATPAFSNLFTYLNLLHTCRVVSLAVSPVADVFFSASLDKTVRLWDLRSTACQGMIHLAAISLPEEAALAPGSSAPASTDGRVRSCLSWDPMGLVIAVAGADNTISLFDYRNYDKGPFFSIRVGWTSALEFGSLTFSPSGKYILASAANANAIFLIDAFSGQKLQEYSSHSNTANRALDASFSPNGEFVLSGSDDKTIRVWDTLSGQEVAVWSGHKDVVRCVRWNPKLMMVRTPNESVVMLRALFLRMFVGMFLFLYLLA
jgi:COMPASS component SWD2